MGRGIKLKTKSDLTYHYYPVESESVLIKVRASNNAHIKLAETTDSDQTIEIILGGWGNTRSAIRRDKNQKCNLRTADILDESKYRGFVVKWKNGTISVRNEDEEQPFVSWSDPTPFPVQYMGVCTGYGATGRWRIQPYTKDKDDETLSNLSLDEGTPFASKMKCCCCCLYKGLKITAKIL